ncbi:Bardet-Biedl syndrome 2 protein homolog [Ctenocephalides felis]|uniref:Bardet-Biedl syndrome 2 protein homolog n=1 Tax=Ctenocephalides felis TaxID=7515 RepID=UPI000E6E116F|nr:Bardet-Biedl syndrome 2 protein homolog [Ctenocephalides felis]
MAQSIYSNKLCIKLDVRASSIQNRSHSAYHVENNTDVFFQEIPEGSSSIIIGYLGSINTPLAIVGGAYAVRGFDATGKEHFWFLPGGNVKALELLDTDDDGLNELITGSDDCFIRSYKADGTLLTEWYETAPVTLLAKLANATRLAYGLSNGTIGVYEDGVRLWRVKSKNAVNSIHGFDMMGLGHDQLITGWSNGKVDVRDTFTGDVLFKVNLSQSVAAVLRGDYRNVGKDDLIACSIEGEICGYVTQTAVSESALIRKQEVIKELMSRKQTLQLELKHYHANERANQDREKTRDHAKLRTGENSLIPANTRLQIGVATNLDSKKPHVELSICTNNETIVRCVLVFAEGIFLGGGESLILYPPPSKVASKLCVPLIPPRDVPVDIHIKAFVGNPECSQYHVFELTRQLPRFCMYAIPQEITSSPKTVSQIGQLSVEERLQRICIWINQNFLLSSDIIAQPTEDQELKLLLTCLRDNTQLLMEFTGDGEVILTTPNMALAADLIQSLASFLKLENLQSEARFNAEETKLRNLIEKLNGLQETTNILQAERAEHLGILRSLAVKAEDARINFEDDIQKYYDEIETMNSDLMRGYQIRMANYEETQEALKSTNAIIKQAARLRVGKYATNMIKQCRTAIKNNNIDHLIKILRTADV